MEISGKQTVSKSPDCLWDILFEEETLEATLPGAQEFKRDGDRFEGTIQRGLAGISLTLSIDVEITGEAEPEWVECEIEGVDNTINSRVNGKGRVELVEVGDGETELVYELSFDFSGKLASLGSRIIKHQVNNEIDNFFSNLREYVDEEDTP